MIGFLHTLFSWPNGIVVGNLLASAIWAPIGIIHLDHLMRRHHREHISLMHRHHREHMEALKNEH
jgi:hypothetical protein